MKTFQMNPNKVRMNQMNQMYLFGRPCHVKIFFLHGGVPFGRIFLHSGSSCHFFGGFCLFLFIFFILVAYWMKQMYIDEPLCSFRRFLPFGDFHLVDDEPLGRVNLHRGSFGSLRTEVV